MAIVHRLAYRLSSPGSHHYTFLIRRFVKYLVVPNYKLVVSKNTSSVITAKWISFLIETLRIALGIPDAEFTELGKLFTEAETLLVKAQDQAERTHVITVECQAAFKALSAKMRFFRDRYFKIPPLTRRLWASGRKTRTIIGACPGRSSHSVPQLHRRPHALMVHLGPMPGTHELDPDSDYGYAIYAGILPPGGATLEQAVSEKHYLMKPPIDGKGLLRIRFIRRQKEKLIFDAEDGGMTVYICSRYENQKGEAGQWGPVASVIIL